MTASTGGTSLRDQRTYYVSDERLRAFGQLSYAQRLHWVEQCSLFVRMAQQAKARAVEKAAQRSTSL